MEYTSEITSKPNRRKIIMIEKLVVSWFDEGDNRLLASRLNEVIDHLNETASNKECKNPMCPCGVTDQMLGTASQKKSEPSRWNEENASSPACECRCKKCQECEARPSKIESCECEGPKWHQPHNRYCSASHKESEGKCKCKCKWYKEGECDYCTPQEPPKESEVCKLCDCYLGECECSCHSQSKEVTPELIKEHINKNKPVLDALKKYDEEQSSKEEPTIKMKCDCGGPPQTNHSASCAIFRNSCL
jgi:hypothetical protein